MHICCAPDATVGCERFREAWDVTGLFYNPNIEPPEEYELRETEARRLAGLMGINYLEIEQDRVGWLEAVKGFEEEPERGERCRRCIEFNLDQSARKAKELNISAFSTTLTASPHKDVDYIHRIGSRIADRIGIDYLAETLRKQDGFKRSLELTGKFGIYRQKYCGCRWSMPVKMMAASRLEALDV